MGFYYVPGSRVIKAHRVTLLERFQMWKARRRRKELPMGRWSL